MRLSPVAAFVLIAASSAWAGCTGPETEECLPGSTGIVVQIVVDPDPAEPEPSVASYPVHLFSDEDDSFEHLQTTTNAAGCAVFDVPAANYRVEASRDIEPCDWWGGKEVVAHDGGRTFITLETSCARVN